MAVAIVSACGGEGTTAPMPQAFVISDDEVRVILSAVPALARIGGVFIIPEANVVVVRTAERDYRALSNVCTHAGCGISQLVSERLRCQCHGSEFDLTGVNVAGPAPSPLARHDAVLDASAGVLRISRRTSLAPSLLRG